MCNELNKLQELVSESYGIPVHFINRCQDRGWQDPAALHREIEYLAHEAEDCTRRVGQVLGFELTTEMLDEAERFRAPYSFPLGRLATLMRESDPTPTSGTITPFLYYLNSMPVTRKAREASVEAISILCDEARNMVGQGIGPVPGGAPRVLYSAHAFADIDVIHLLEEHDISVPLFESALFAPDGCLKPDTADYQGLLLKAACAQSQRSTFNNLRGAGRLYHRRLQAVPPRRRVLVCPCHLSRQFPRLLAAQGGSAQRAGHPLSGGGRRHVGPQGLQHRGDEGTGEGFRRDAGSIQG